MFKISKLLSMLLGLSGFLRMGIVDGDGGEASEPLNMTTAASAFDSFLAVDDQNETENTAAQDDTPEAAAERLAKQELSDEVEGDGDEPEAAQTFTVKIDGKEVTLTADEIAESHKNGLRQADYTRKTMEAAEVKKAADAEKAAAKAERDTYAQKLNHYTISTEAQLNALQSELTEDLLDSDPVEYLRKERTLREGQAKLQQARGELSQLSEQHKAEQEAAHQSFIRDQQEKLIAKMPAWKDPAKANADVAAIKTYLAANDFQPDEQLPDHRMVILAHKAMQFDQLMDRAKGAVKKVAALPTKVERPGTPAAQSDRRTEALKRVSKTGSINDAANAFGALFNT